jgi:hypothetical protein
MSLKFIDCNCSFGIKRNVLPFTITDKELIKKELQKLNIVKAIASHSSQKEFDLVYVNERIVEEIVSSEDKIPVILTGEPNDYVSKAEFIRLNPQYRVTGKWTEVQIVFTNSFESNTGKMKKAREKGIEIKLY